MTMVSINTNVGAIFAAHSSYKVNKSMETSMARLSSGKRINSAADDAAGFTDQTLVVLIVVVVVVAVKKKKKK